MMWGLLIIGMIVAFLIFTWWACRTPVHRELTLAEQVAEKIWPRMEPPRLPRRFTAWTDCPKCGEIAVHAIREPWRLMPTPGVSVEWQQRERHWQGLPPDEAVFEVIRTCKCGNEWGEL